MKVVQHKGKKVGETSTFDLTGLDYEMLIIVLQGLRVKKRRLRQRVSFVVPTALDPSDKEKRKQLSDVSKYLVDLDNQLEKNINTIEALIDG